MSKLLDNLTGYFFTTGTADHRSPDRAAAVETAPAAAADEGMAAPFSYAPAEDEETREGLAGRLRDRLLRRPVHRQTPAPAPGTWAEPAGDAASGRLWNDGSRAWGDDDRRASPRIHPTASVDPRADLAPDVEVGPFCVIGPHVSLGPGCRLLPHATVLGHTICGSDNTFHPFCVVGGDPQDKKFDGETTYLVVGDGNEFREHVTVHTGTAKGGGTTRIGDQNLVMVGAHVGHDATIGSHCILGNNILLAGHVVIEDRVSMMAGSAVHHFVTIGTLAFIGGYSQIHVDVPPYVKVDGEDKIRTVNNVGLRRSGLVDEEDIAQLHVAVRQLFVSKKKPISVVIGEMLADPQLNGRVREVIDTVRRRALGKHGRYLEGQRQT
jgi:UDP-N-acetylglucosamine acyltransferase